MLVLTRKVDESIAIGDTIVVTILGVEGDRVKVGIAAPPEVVILRQEVFQAVQDQTKIQERLAAQPEPEAFNRLRELLSTEGEGETDSAAGSEEDKSGKKGKLNQA